MAVVEIKRQMRVTSRAWRKLLRRQIKPAVAFRVISRSCLKVLHALSLLTLLIVGGSIIATLMVSTRLVFKLRKAASRN